MQYEQSNHHPSIRPNNKKSPPHRTAPHRPTDRLRPSPPPLLLGSRTRQSNTHPTNIPKPNTDRTTSETDEIIPTTTATTVPHQPSTGRPADERSTSQPPHRGRPVQDKTGRDGAKRYKYSGTYLEWGFHKISIVRIVSPSGPAGLAVANGPRTFYVVFGSWRPKWDIYRSGRRPSLFFDVTVTRNGCCPAGSQILAGSD